MSPGSGAAERKRITMTILIVLLLILFLLKKISKVVEGNIVLLFANIGTGKTTLLARYAKRELKKIKKGKSKFKTVISNTPIVGCIFVPDIRKLLQKSTPENTLILVDEGGIVWNNRKMKITDEEIEYLKLIRHYNSKLIIVSQSYEDVDITIRRIYGTMYILTRFSFFTLIKPIRKYITIEKETEQIIDGYKFRNILSWTFLFRPRYYSMFDTLWKPDGIKIPDYTPFTIIPFKKRKSVIQKLRQPAGLVSKFVLQRKKIKLENL